MAIETTIEKEERAVSQCPSDLIGFTIFLFAGIWNLTQCIRKMVEIFKWDLMDHLCRIIQIVVLGII